jgi:hypothetical protein
LPTELTARAATDLLLFHVIANIAFTIVMPPAELCRPSPNEQGRIRVAPLSEACEAA